MLFYWYPLIWWFDMPMHFLGGVFVGLLLSYLLKKIKIIKEDISVFKFSLIITTLTFFVGMIWEGYEYFVQFYTHAYLANFLDSLSDLSFDIVGSIMAVILSIKFYKYGKTN